jgi:hypothetical protein
MSRRITAFVLAASTTLIATQAHADRECFENSCRLPAVVEPAPAVSAEGSQASAERAAHEHAVEPAARPLVKPAHHAETATAPGEPARLPPAYAKAPQPPVREAAPLRVPPPEPAAYVRPVRAPEAERTYVRSEGRTGGVLIFNVPTPSYGMEGVAAVRPYAFHVDANAPRLYVLAPNAKIISIDDGH